MNPEFQEILKKVTNCEIDPSELTASLEKSKKDLYKYETENNVCAFCQVKNPNTKICPSNPWTKRHTTGPK